MKGIDVSKYQGKIDWAKVKAAGIGFCMVRAGYGMYIHQKDPCFDANMAGAKNAGLPTETGIPVGVYWYSYATDVSQAIREAEVCLEVIAPYKGQILLPVAYDWEDPSLAKMSVSQTAACCKAFLDRIQAAGYRPMLYSFSNWLQTRLKDPSLDGFPRWVAHYGVEKPVSSKPYLIWQYSSKGHVDGISGAVDLDEGYDGLIPPQTGWEQKNSQWYWREDGVIVENRWVKDDGFWYYLGPSGAMLTGMRQIKGKLNYLNETRREGTPKGACVITNESGEIEGA